MRKEVVDTIDGYEYAFTQFPPKKSLNVLTRLGKILGKPLATLMANKESLDQEVDLNFFGQAIFDLASSLGEDELYEVMTQVCESVVVTSGTKENPVTGSLKDQKFDMHFGDKKGLLRMIKVGKKALEVNYGDFLEEIAEFSGVFLAKDNQKSTSAE